MKDIYDKAVDYFTNHPEKIYQAWNCGANLEIAQRQDDILKPEYAFALFGTVPNGTGCLTEIRNIGRSAATPELTQAIQKDERLPNDGTGITVENLPVFAEWQRKLHATTT